MILAAATALALAACSSSAPTPTPAPTELSSPSESATPSGSATPKPTIVPATNTDAIVVTGDFGKTPTVKFPTPWAIDKTQARVLIAGSGAEIKADSMVEINYHGVNGRTGTVFDESFTSGKTVAFALNGVIPGLSTGLMGQKVGSRVLVAITGPDGYDQSGGAPDVGIEVGDTLIFVVDIVSATLPGPAGTAVTPPANLPTVTGELNRPVVTVNTSATPPSALVVQPLIVGAGRKLGAKDGIQVDYVEVAWSTGRVVKQTFGYQPVTGTLDATVPGWQQGLTGQSVGSRVLLIVPPSEAYPTGNRKIGVKEGETMVYVIDILFSQSAA